MPSLFVRSEWEFPEVIQRFNKCPFRAIFYHRQNRWQFIDDPRCNGEIQSQFYWHFQNWHWRRRIPSEWDLKYKNQLSYLTRDESFSIFNPKTATAFAKFAQYFHVCLDTQVMPTVLNSSTESRPIFCQIAIEMHMSFDDKGRPQTGEMRKFQDLLKLIGQFGYLMFNKEPNFNCGGCLVEYAFMHKTCAKDYGLDNYFHRNFVDQKWEEDLLWFCDNWMGNCR